MELRYLLSKIGNACLSHETTSVGCLKPFFSLLCAIKKKGHNILAIMI
jgi:hypothetical protein